MTATATKKLSADQAQKLAAAELAVKQAQDRLDERKKERAEVRERYRDRVPADVELEIAGYKIKRFMKATGDRFSLRRYLDAGHSITLAMREAITSDEYEVWDVKETRTRTELR